MSGKRKTWNDLILENAERSANQALVILEDLEKNNDGAPSLFQAGKERIQEYHSDIREITQLYKASLENEKIDELDGTDPDSLVHSLVRAPRELSGIVSAISIWCTQKQYRDFTSDNLFAQLLSERILERLNLHIKPRIIFGARFSVVNLGREIVIEVPFVYMRWYSKWLSIAHEIGHIYRGSNLEFIKQFNISDLLKMLTRNIPKKWRQDPNSGLVQLVVNWAFRWTGELIADFVAVAACGPGYIVSLIIEHFLSTAMTVLDTHPPTDFRIACLIEAGEKFEQDVSPLQDYRKSESAIFAKLDSVQSRFVDEQLIPDFVHWMIQQPKLSNLRFDWKESWTTRDILSKGEKPNVPFEVEFGALTLLELERNTTSFYEELKRRVQI